MRHFATTTTPRQTPVISLTRHQTRTIAWVIVVLGVSSPVFAQLKAYPTRYYIIHSDLDEETVREAAFRITKVAEEYALRCSSFTGRITERLPFHLYRRAEDYYAAGGLRGSIGVFTGDRLMAIAGERMSPDSWSTVQHEGFHQFARAVITGRFPPWINEGMAEYFGEAVFTGDGLTAGVIPQGRLEYTRRQIRVGNYKSVAQMMKLGQRLWNHQLDPANYNQAWSMVQFLAHGHDGVYQKRLDGFIRDLSVRRLTWEHSWSRNFGAEPKEFEAAWKDYWLTLPNNPTSDLFAEAMVKTLTSFLARAYSQGQSFKSAEDFFQSAKQRKLESHPMDKLPDSLLVEAMGRMRLAATWKLHRKGRRAATLICTLKSGPVVTGSFALKGDRVGSVTTKVSHPKRKRRRP